MKNRTTALVDEHLQAVQGMQEAETDPFFYTRLKARMEKGKTAQGWSFPLKPAWVITTLLLLLVLNGFMLEQQFKTNKSKTTASSSLQNFAESYDQTISSY